MMAAAGGQLLPLLLPQELRTIFMVCLLVIFGAKMLHEAAVYREAAEEAGRPAPTTPPASRVIRRIHILPQFLDCSFVLWGFTAPVVLLNEIVARGRRAHATY